MREIEMTVNQSCKSAYPSVSERIPENWKKWKFLENLKIENKNQNLQVSGKSQNWFQQIVLTKIEIYKLLQNLDFFFENYNKIDIF